jgi:hypothetical protein
VGSGVEKSALSGSVLGGFGSFRGGSFGAGSFGGVGLVVGVGVLGSVFGLALGSLAFAEGSELDGVVPGPSRRSPRTLPASCE